MSGMSEAQEGIHCLHVAQNAGSMRQIACCEPQSYGLYRRITGNAALLITEH